LKQKATKIVTGGKNEWRSETNVASVKTLVQDSNQSNHVSLEPPFPRTKPLPAKSDRWLWGRKCFLVGFNSDLGTYLKAESSVFIGVCLVAFSRSSVISTSIYKKQKQLRKAFNIRLRCSDIGKFYVLTFLFLPWHLQARMLYRQHVTS